MKSAIAAVMATAISFAAAQQATLPSCAQPCVVNATTGSTISGCNAVDIACICGNQDFLGDIACCLTSSCEKADQDQALTYAKQLCESAGVTNLPDQITCDQQSNSTTTSPAPSDNTDEPNAAAQAKVAAGILGAALVAAIAMI